jgi:branched-chain amino acid transport system permease protein
MAGVRSMTRKLADRFPRRPPSLADAAGLVAKAARDRHAPGGALVTRAGRVALSGPAILAVVLLLLGLLISSQSYLIQGATSLTFALAATGLGLALGLGGEHLLGQLSIFAAGAYVTAVLTANHGWNFWPAAIVGTAVAALFGLLLSLIGLRVSQFYFALIGFFVVYLIPNIVQEFASQTGGTVGIGVPDQPSIFGIQLTARGMYFLAAIAIIASLVLVKNLRQSPLGIHMRRLREGPIQLAMSGIPPWRVRIAMYVTSSVLAGLGGAIYSHISGYILPDDFDLTTTIMLFAAVMVGGATTLLGPTIGVVLLYVIPNVVVYINGYSDLVYGGIVLVSILLFRGGVEQASRDLMRSLLGHLRARASKSTTALIGPQRFRAAGRAGRLDQPVGDVDIPALVDILWSLRANSLATGHTEVVVTGARKHYGGVQAIDMGPDDVFAVRQGQVHVLLGPNGSGKTTLLNAICGITRLDSGTVRIGDDKITGTPVYRVARAGLSRSFQSPNFPEEVSPVDILAASLAHMRSVSYFHWLTGDPPARRANAECRRQALDIAWAAGLGEAAQESCGGLTSGRRRMLDVLVALVSQSRIALLDEPAAGLSGPERQALRRIIRSLAERGVGFLVVEHDLSFSLGVADYVTVLSAGKQLAHGQPEEVRDNRDVRAVLVGTEQ